MSYGEFCDLTVPNPWSVYSTSRIKKGSDMLIWLMHAISSSMVDETHLRAHRMHYVSLVGIT